MALFTKLLKLNEKTKKKKNPKQIKQEGHDGPRSLTWLKLIQTIT
jgi:hypothetical protein